MPKNPNWTRDEIILALDLYLPEGQRQLDNTHPKVIELSQLLNKLPVHQKELRESEFQNPNGASMKLGNFLGIDPEYEGDGLSRGSKLEQEVWGEFAQTPQKLNQVAQSINSSYKNLKEPDVIYETNDVEFIEGRLLARLHQQRERNPKFAKQKKVSVLKKHGNLVCEVCTFDFAVAYGELGVGYAECHHLIPLADLSQETKTKLSDLAIVCANCHRMLHRPKEMLNIEELREITQNIRMRHDTT